MDLPRGARLKHGGLADLSRFCEELPKGFKGSAVFFIKSPKRFFEANLLLSEGRIVAASLKDVDGGTEVAKEEVLAELAKKVAESSGDLDISSFSDYEMTISAERNLYAILDSPVELSVLLSSILMEVKKKADEAESFRREVEEARRKADEEKKRLEEERARRDEEKRRWEAEKRRIEQERLRKEEEERRRREEEERKRKVEEERARKEAEERKKREEEERQRKIEEERKRKAVEEARRQAEEQARRMEEERKAKEVEEARRRDEEERRKAEEEARRKAEEEERLEEGRRKKEEEERRRGEEEEARRKSEEEKRKRVEEERKRKAEEEERRIKAEIDEEIRVKAEAEKARKEAEEKKRAAEEEKARKAEELKRRKEEEERKKKEEAERKHKEAEEKKIKAEEEKARKAEEDARKAEELKRRKEEEERKKKEDDARRKVEEEKRKADEAKKAEEEEARKNEDLKAQVKRAVEVVKAGGKQASGPEAEARNRAKSKIAEWNSKGYVTEPLERALEADAGTFSSALKKFEFDVSVLQRIEKQLDSLDTAGFEDRAKALRFKLRDTQRLVDLMNEVTQLEKDINAKSSGKIAPQPAAAAPVEEPKMAAIEKKEEAKPAEPVKGVSKKDSFANLLRNLELSLKDIKGVAVTTKNGLPVAVRLPRELDVEAFCGMSAAMYGAAETTMMELKRSTLLWVYTETDDSTLIVVDAGSSALLVALIGAGANIGLVLVKLKYTADTVRTLMK